MPAELFYPRLLELLEVLLYGLQVLVFKYLVHLDSQHRAPVQAFLHQIAEQRVPFHVFDLFVIDVVDRVVQVVSREGRFAAHKFVHEAAKRPNVNLLSVHLTFDDFGTQEILGANACLSVRLLFAEKNRDSEIRNLDPTIRRAEYVLRLHIAMQHFLLVHIVEAMCNAVARELKEFLGQLPIPARLRNHVLERATIHVL